MAKITDHQRARLYEIADGHKDWCGRDVYLERKGLVQRATYANGDFAELTDAGCDIVDQRH